MEKNRLRNTRIIFRTHIIRHKEGNSNYGGNHENEELVSLIAVSLVLTSIGWAGEKKNNSYTIKTE
jgi:hypothetical protein